MRRLEYIRLEPLSFNKIVKNFIRTYRGPHAHTFGILYNKTFEHLGIGIAHDKHFQHFQKYQGIYKVLLD